jgi:hypothetical protein
MDPRNTRIPAGLIAVALALATMIPGLARAQISDVDPYYVVVEAEGATLRSGDLRNYYPIGEAAVGQALRVDGVGRQWLRVSYPLQTRALIRGDKAEHDRRAGVVRLTSPGRPKAWNLEYGVNGSWKDIPTEMLPAGTEFTFIEVASDRNGATHYVVEAPRSSRAFIETAHARKASQGEADAYLRSIGGERALVGEVSPRPEAQPAERAERGTMAAEVSAQQAGAGESAAPGESSAPDASIAQQTPRGTPVPEPTPDPTDRPIAGLKELEAAFQNVQKQKAVDAELEPLLAEFRAALEKVDPTAENEPLRMAIEQRISMLEIRKDLQRQLREVHAARSAMDANAQRVAAAAGEAKASRQYTLIGRLETSAIYDGERLPLMFRIQSVGEATSRTLGYIRPAPDMDLAGKTGQLVGVIGRAAMDERLKLNIVTPVRVDTLSADEPEQAAVSGEG